MKNREKPFRRFWLALVPLGVFFLSQVCQAVNVNYKSNREPLIEKAYIKLPLGAVQPKGWIFHQLKLAAAGMTGHLDEIWPDVGADNGWMGGKGDSWERGPYWLDGLVPLAYILKDKKLIDKVEKWINWTLESQDKDGMFGPRPDAERKFTEDEKKLSRMEKNKDDWWPRMIMLKVLQSYYEATADKRVIDFMIRYLRYQTWNLPKKPLNHWTHWAKERGGENLSVVYWLYNRTGKPFLLDLGRILFAQTEQWSERFLSEFPETWNWHGVNTAMGIKQPVVYYQQAKDTKYLKAVAKGIRDLMRYHGQVTGMFSGDEMLHGANPTHGTELCTVVEYMFSLETILRITGDPWYADLLERVTYNALPTQVKADFCARQYFQLPNQVACDTEWHNFITKHNESELLFGLETGYGCCTANFHQGWPKYAAQLWLATRDNGLAALSYAPCRVTAKAADNKEVIFTESTNYPFDDTILFIFESTQSVSFPLHLRIPGWCDAAAVYINEKPYNKNRLKPGSILKITRNWEKGDIVRLQLPMKVKISYHYENSAAVERGPLVYALKIGEKWEKIAGEEPYADYRVLPVDPWNFGILRECVYKPEESFIVRAKEVRDQPWTIHNAPVIITVRGKKIPKWKPYGGITGPIPYSPDYYTLKNENPEETLMLIPYGCTKLRISLFPLVY
jgi:DUF1680 family protein